MKSCCKLSIIGLSLALGITGAISMFLLGILAWQMQWGNEMVALIGSLYVGFDASLKGSIIGAVWGFADWFIGGFIIALIYNCILCCRCMSKVCKSSEGVCETKPPHEHHK